MVTSTPKIFVDEAESLLTSIRGSVLVRLQDGVKPEHLRAPLVSARALNSLASSSGDEWIAVAAETLEAWLTLLAAETEPISHTRTRSLLDQISELEVALIAHRATTTTDTVEVADFVDESFRSFSRDLCTQNPQPKSSSESTDKFDVDAEMLQVFRQEADALLNTIQTNLTSLSTDFSDREALWQIKRAAHTFKGAAGIVGLHRLSEIAHRIEDLLEGLTTRGNVSDGRVVSVLINATECLQSLASGDDSQSLGARLENLDDAFTDTLRAITASPQPSPNPGAPIPSDAPIGNEKRRCEVPSNPDRSSVVRISLERLDDLVDIIRELVSSRTVFEGRINELAVQVQESCNNTLRLQAASAKLQNHDRSSHAPNGSNGRSGTIDQTTYELSETARDAAMINTSVREIKTGFEDVFVHQRGVIERIQGRLIRLRNVEFGTIFTRLQRAVRLTCDEEGKAAEIEIENGGVEVDTQIIDAVIEPLMHLLKNAVVHGIEPPEVRRMLGKPEAGRIVIKVGTDGAYILLSVSDDGGGIAYQTLVEKAVAAGLITRDAADRMSDAEIRELIYLPGLTTAEKLNLNAGRGVGMSIVRESVVAANGTVTFETLPQKGTTFRIRVPLPFADLFVAEALKGQKLPEEPVHDLNVLVVDDSPSVRLMTSRTLQNAGWHVQAAGNGIEALNCLAEMQSLPNVILSDIEMPRMGGYEFLAALRDDPALKAIPVVIISSRVGVENREHALAAGASEYFTKPYQDRELIEFLYRFARSENLVS